MSSLGKTCNRSCGRMGTEPVSVTGNRRVWKIAKTVAPGQDWTGEAGSWMGSLELYSIANAAKNSSGDNVYHLMMLEENRTMLGISRGR